MRASSRIAAAALAVGGLLGTAGCADERVAGEPDLRPVRTHTVSATGSVESRTLAGVARAGVESRLSFRVPGTVRDVEVDLGEQVVKGQVLARLDPTDFELRVEEAEAGLAQAQAGLRKAEADWERVVALYENRNASRSEYDAALASRESAAAQLRARLKQLEQARQQLGYTVLRAPADGAVALVEVEVNESVQAGQPVFLLTSRGRPEVEVAVPEVLITRVEEGLPVSVTFDALPGREFSGEVAEVGVAAVGPASTFTVTVRLADTDAATRPGMAAEVSFSLTASVAGPRIVVPAVAVGEDREGRFVYILDEEIGEGRGVVRRRPVVVGAPVPGFGGIEILDGLREGEVIVTAGARRLSDGMAVRTSGPLGSGA